MKVLVLALAFAMILSASGISAVPGKVKLEHKLSVGDSLVSEVTRELYVWANFREIGGPLFEHTANVDGKITVDVVSVDENGAIEARVSSEESGNIKQFGGKTILIPATQRPPQVFRIAKTGQIVRCDIGEYKHRHPKNPLADIDDMITYITMQHSTALIGLPDKEVGAGDVWTIETPLKSPDGRELKLTTYCRIFTLGKMGEYECAWILSKSELPFKIELAGDFEGYSSVVVEGMFVWEGRSCFAYQEGRTITDRSSLSSMMMIEIPMQEGSAKSFSTTLGNSKSVISLSRQTQ